MHIFIRPPVHNNWSTLAVTVTFLQFSGNRFTELGASFNNGEKEEIVRGREKEFRKNVEDRVEESQRPSRGAKKTTDKQKPREGGRIDRDGRKERVVEGLNSSGRVERERETKSKRMREIETEIGGGM